MSNSPHITERHLRDELAQANERLGFLLTSLEEGSLPWWQNKITDYMQQSVIAIAKANERIAELEKEVKLKHDQRSDLTQWFEHRSVYGELTLEQIDSMSPRDLADHCYERKAEQVEVLKDKMKAVTKELDEAIDVLTHLHGYQNGCPLPSYISGWTIAMEKAEKLILQHTPHKPQRHKEVNL